MSRRILVINLKFMGDLLIATPVLRALRAAHPDAYVAVLVRKGYEGDGHWIARKPVACQPCERIECADPCCMTAVTVEDVVALAVQALDGRR
jgi:hypothetical protein